VLARLQVLRAELSPGRAVLHWGQETGAVSPEALVAWVGDASRQARLLPPSKIELRYPAGLDVGGGLEYLRTELETLTTGGTSTPDKAGA